MRKWLVAALLLVGIAALGQVVPKGIIIEPPQPGGLEVHIWVDKPAYAVGEYVTIHFSVNKPAYIYIWDIQPDGRVTLIFPNGYDPQNFFQPGTYTVPTSRRTQDYSFRVTPPTGTEYLQILATTRQINLGVEFSIQLPFPLLGQSPDQWKAQFEARLKGIVPEPTERAFDYTSFQIVSGPAPEYGTLTVETTPPYAELYVDNAFRGYTPKTLTLTAGWHDVLIRKTGYQDWSRRIYLVSGRTRRISVVLQPVTPQQPPVAEFSYSPSNPYPGQPVTFDASASYDPDGYIVSYQWDFNGDGAIDATGRVVTHTFAAPGTYNVRLIVTDNSGATGQTTHAVTVGGPAPQPPVARFTYSPAPAQVGQPVTFNASASYDPDGYITSYQWDLDGNGTIDATGQVVTHVYYTTGTYQVTLYVTDNQGLTSRTTQPVQVGSPAPPIPPAPGPMPPMDGIPGIYVWGSDKWNITVNGSPSWGITHSFRIEVRTDGTFVNVSSSGPTPLGLTPEPTHEGWKLVFQGSVGSNRITYSFEVRNASSIYFDLQFDMDGDGTLDTSTGFVHLGVYMVNPPTNPFVVGVPDGYSGPFVPSINYKVGRALIYTEKAHFIFWMTTIRELEGSST